MQLSKWQAFLADKELNGTSFHPPDGKYMFGKILHDVLECLNMYLGCLEVNSVLADKGQEIPVNVSAWLNLRIPQVESLLLEITPLWRYEKELLVESSEWPQLIKRVGLVLVEAFPSLLDGYNKLEMPVQSKHRFLVEAAINNLRKLKLIWIDIQNEDYKQLWIKKYDVS